MSSNRLDRAVATAALALCACVYGAAAQSVADDLATAEARFSAARTAAVHLLAPRAYTDASDLLRDAYRRDEDGASASGVREQIGRALGELERAEGLADRVRGRFSDALAARERAAAEGADERAAQSWEGAERELERAGREAQGGDFEDAVGPAGRATTLYRRAAATARSARLLGEAIAARQAAISAGASELAPATFASGEEALGAAEAALDDGTDAQVRRDGDRAASAFRRAAWIAALADSVRSRAIPLERLVNAHERDLARLAEAAGIAPPDLRAEGAGATEPIERAVRDLLARNASLEADLRAERETAARLEERVGSLEDALTETERRFTDARDELLARQRRDDRLRETSALFAPEEAEVSVTGNLMTLRLYGLTFESGSDEVEESMEPLLTKVERVLLEFPEATIRIEGHTDSQGNPDRNRALSQSRAIAIREYLLSRLPISSSRMEAFGHGEDRPIARNDTEEGRARNRRIEVILTLPG